MVWSQVYDPLGNIWLSSLFAALPVLVLLGAIGIFEVKAHIAALLGLVTALLVAIIGFGMPADLAAMSAVYGAGFGLMPIGWIILNVIFLYQLTNEKGEFDVLRRSIRSISDDRRMQVLFIAFCFGAFFEGAAGFGTPVAVTAAMLMGLGFSPLSAAGLCLIANTAPVAFGALGTPVIALSAVTGLDLYELSGMIGRQLPFFSLIVPFWLIWAMVGFRRMAEVWPPILVAGVSFAVPQYLVSNFHGPWLVDIVAAIISMLALAGFLRVWHPKRPMTEAPRDWSSAHVEEAAERPESAISRNAVLRAWMPWAILSVFVFIWGMPQAKAFIDSIWSLRVPVAGLHELVMKVPPVSPEPHPEAAIFNFSILSMTGTGILLSGIVSGFLLGYSPAGLVRMYGRTIYMIRFSLLTIACMLALGYVTRYSGTDATMGLAFAHTGWFYPLFGTLLGWLGVAVTGSDTASNVLFGGLQKVTAQQLGLNPVLMAAANSSGGVMGKMIDAQSIVVASTATKWYGHEGSILRYVFFHSIALAVLVGLLVMAQAYMWPFTAMVPDMATVAPAAAGH
ncbi:MULTISPECIES: L-lactate permease [unclassified Paracoccus (in: a-proteobacteria)]|uniref:L-lactate permease n=1 Tax=unclassified Paracoccus (in: a-proteobacteria) TaxID=2688777 RepID=UPI001602ECE4|nr:MULTISPECIES: L-lactate permease [unclassified Paracoccus (in: a-proteobacteria)]MBB1492502.1 L-lactate permease [Paracoccus sp. MC1854]MBB1499380.1 L-lactate permease [Paracoccus sp. MC1862]QQO43948.1 L-lactate permease [Paracoccus sp. MC1862]